MLIVYWSPVSGQGCATSNMLATATMLALDFPLKLLLAHTYDKKTMLEHAFARLKSTDDEKGMEAGMKALVRLAQCDLLTPASLRDHTDSILRDRLDLIAGALHGSERERIDSLTRIIDVSNRYYDVLFLNVSPEHGNPVTEYAMSRADLLVVNLPQSVSVLHSFFSNGKPTVPSGCKAPILYAIGSFERTAKLSADRIAGKFGVKPKHISVIPRNTRFLDSLNDGNAVEYFLRAMSVKKRFLEFQEEVYFIDNVRTLGRRLMSALDVLPAEEVSMEQA